MAGRDRRQGVTIAVAIMRFHGATYAVEEFRSATATVMRLVIDSSRNW
jgi:hypothetical protein